MDSSDPNYAPDITIELAGRTYTFRAVLSEMKLLQKRCGGLVHLANKMQNLTITMEEVAAIIYHGCGGEKEKVISIQAIEEIIFDKGLIKFMKPCSDFIGSVLTDGPKGVKSPKTDPPEKT